MAEYIEREAVVIHLQSQLQKMEQHGLGETRTAVLVGRFIKQLKEAPTADVVEVRHGKVVQKDHDEWWGAVYECCECNEEFMLNGGKRAMCCPYCGAYLSLRVEGEKPLLYADMEEIIDAAY